MPPLKTMATTPPKPRLSATSYVFFSSPPLPQAPQLYVQKDGATLPFLPTLNTRCSRIDKQLAPHYSPSSFWRHHGRRCQHALGRRQRLQQAPRGPVLALVDGLDSLPGQRRLFRDDLGAAVAGGNPHRRRDPSAPPPRLHPSGSCPAGGVNACSPSLHHRPGRIHPSGARCQNGESHFQPHHRLRGDTRPSALPVVAFRTFSFVRSSSPHRAFWRTRCPDPGTACRPSPSRSSPPRGTDHRSVVTILPRTGYGVD